MPILRKLSKGVIMPLLPRLRGGLHRRAATWSTCTCRSSKRRCSPRSARLRRRGVVLTYQCDLRLPHGLLNRIVEASLRPLNHLAARRRTRSW